MRFMSCQSTSVWTTWSNRLFNCSFTNVQMERSLNWCVNFTTKLLLRNNFKWNVIFIVQVVPVSYCFHKNSKQNETACLPRLLAKILVFLHLVVSCRKVFNTQFLVVLSTSTKFQRLGWLPLSSSKYNARWAVSPM